MQDEDARWMTYEALAQARGTTKRAAVVLVRRKKWPRQRNNAGHVTALVPVTWAEPNAPNGAIAEPAHDTPNGAGHDAGHAIEALERTVEALREAHAGALASLQTAHERELTLLQERIASAELAARIAQDAAEQLRQADATRKARGLLARLRDALQGR